MMMNIEAQKLFEYEKQRGERVEQELLKRFKKKYPKSYKKEGNFKWYDIYIPEKNMRIEVKFDEVSERTDNFFIEYEFEGEPAGIAITEADFYIIADTTTCYMVGTEWLRWIIKEKDAYKHTFTNKAGLVTKGYLVKRHWVTGILRLNSRAGKIFER